MTETAKRPLTWDGVLDVLRRHPSGLTNENIAVLFGHGRGRGDVTLLTRLMFEADVLERKAGGITGQRREGSPWVYFVRTK